MPGRVKCGGTEVEIVVAHGCRTRKKLICGPVEEIVVAHGRLPSPAPTCVKNCNIELEQKYCNQKKKSKLFPQI